MHFIKLTESETGNEVFVRPEAIAMINSYMDKNGSFKETLIQGTGGFGAFVKETPRSILGLVEQHYENGEKVLDDLI